MVDSDQLDMSFDRGGKAFGNEQKFPFVVEAPVAANGLDVELNGRIVGFHKARRIPPRHGRTIWRNEQRYYRWCFSDLETARAFVEQFGGAFYKTTGNGDG
jgi:hypothetical protein